MYQRKLVSWKSVRTTLRSSWKFLATWFVTFWELIPTVSKIIVSVINEMVLFVVISLTNEFSYWDLCPFCLAGPRLPPGEEVLLIQKDYANGGTKAFRRSAPAITLQESPEINNFLYQGDFNQMSILWLLSEFAVIKFCKGI